MVSDLVPIGETFYRMEVVLEYFSKFTHDGIQGCGVTRHCSGVDDVTCGPQGRAE